MASRKNSTRIISDDEEFENEIIIPEGSDSDSVEIVEPPEESAYREVSKVVVLTPYCDRERAWWNKLIEEVPLNEQCKIINCKFAPQGHRRHSCFRRSYSTNEIRLIIQYLIHYEEISNGKGLRIWEDMHSRGYMQHRTVQSLNNNFKKYLLRDIRLYNLPKELEERFLELRS